jgi:cytochrome P450
VKGRRNMQKIMSNLLRKRLTKPNVKHGDFLELIVEELQTEKPTIDEKFATDALVALLFTSFVTLAPILTLAFKFLSDNPEVIKALEV